MGWGRGWGLESGISKVSLEHNLLACDSLGNNVTRKHSTLTLVNMRSVLYHLLYLSCIKHFY